MAAAGDNKDVYSNCHCVGIASMNVTDLASPAKLRGIQGLNWPNPPLTIDYLTYCYLDEPSRKKIQEVATLQEAEIRASDVRKDGNKTAHYIYHAKDAEGKFVATPIPVQFVIEDVLVGQYTGRRFLAVVHTPVNVKIEKPTVACAPLSQGTPAFVVKKEKGK